MINRQNKLNLNGKQNLNKWMKIINKFFRINNYKYNNYKNN